MTHAPRRIADLVGQIADRAENLAPQDEKLRALLTEMQELTGAVPRPARSRPADDPDCEFEEMFNNMPI